MKPGRILALGVCLVAVTGPAAASCTEARAVTSSTSARASFIYTPGHPFRGDGLPGGNSVTYYIQGVFWSFGGGDPAYGRGNDSGYFRGVYPYGENSWLMPSGTGPAFLGGAYGHWQYSTVDGCISRDGSDPDRPDADECLVVLLTDQGREGISHFALVSGPADPATWDFRFTPEGGVPEKILLAPIPRPEVLRASRPDSGKLMLDVRVDTGTVERAGGYYLGCRRGEILEGYRLYARRVPSGTQPSAAFNSQALRPLFGPEQPPRELLTPQVVPLGREVRVELACASGEDLYLCATLTFGGVVRGAASYELQNCSANSPKISCSR